MILQLCFLKKRLFSSCALLLPSLFWLNSSYACTVEVSSLNFGHYDVFSTSPVDVTGNISIRCSSLIRQYYQIQLSAGQASYANRAMKYADNILLYNLYIDSSRSLVWGDGSAGTATQSDSSWMNSEKNFPIYGRILPGQNVAGGSYNDYLVVTVEY